MLSMISFAIHSRAMGSRDVSRRKTSPKLTTKGPDLHTIPRTAGTCRSAEKRSLHPLQKFARSASGLIPFNNDAGQRRAKREAPRNSCAAESWRQTRLPSFLVHVGFHS